MMTTFAGEPLASCGALRRPARLPPVRRGGRCPVPEAWLWLWHRCLGVHVDLAGTAWQAMAACGWSEVQALYRTVQLWQQYPEALIDFGQWGVSPQRLCKCVELLVLDGRLSALEAAILEDGICQHLAYGRWKGTV